jgi:TRAP-type C4-dicarboxylate transport system permease small subunit
MAAWKKGWFAADRLIFKAVKFVVFCCTVLMVVVSTMQVLMRYILSMPIKWGNEFCCFMLVYDVFLGAALGLREAGHVRLEIEKMKLPKAVMALFHLISDAAVYIFLIIYLVYGYQFAMKNGSTLSEVMKWPYITLYSILPISGILMLWGQTSVLLEQSERKEKNR